MRYPKSRTSQREVIAISSPLSIVTVSSQSRLHPPRTYIHPHTATCKNNATGWFCQIQIVGKCRLTFFTSNSCPLSLCPNRLWVKLWPRAVQKINLTIFQNSACVALFLDAAVDNAVLPYKSFRTSVCSGGKGRCGHTPSSLEKNSTVKNAQLTRLEHHRHTQRC